MAEGGRAGGGGGRVVWEEGREGRGEEREVGEGER